MRLLYTCLWIFALPLVLARLFWLSLREPGYRQHIAERFGYYPTPSKQPTIWVHAVSVGETRAAEPLIRELMQSYPTHPVVLTHMTPTGRATGAILFQAEIANHQLTSCFLPYDIPILIRRFLKRAQPIICILMETEVWPNLIHACHQQSIPVVLVNARLSLKSLRKAKRCASLIRPAGSLLTCIAAQTEIDAQHIKQLSTAKMVITGNTKFDVNIPAEKIAAGQQLRQQWGKRWVLLCASTREGEEELILDAYAKARNHHLLLVIVPRHPQRFDLVEQTIQQRGFTMQRRARLAQNEAPADIQVVLGDSMGEMISYYVSCDIAFIGGSLLPLGGQNLIEACAVEKPVLLGPHTFNFETISANAIDANAALRIANAEQLFQVAQTLLQDEQRRTTMGKSALAFAQQHRGATARTMTLLRQIIEPEMK
jgi:3-deoxy-D-manno-octulosonic-acid transferase